MELSEKGKSNNFHSNTDFYICLNCHQYWTEKLCAEYHQQSPQTDQPHKTSQTAPHECQYEIYHIYPFKVFKWTTESLSNYLKSMPYNIIQNLKQQIRQHFKQLTSITNECSGNRNNNDTTSVNDDNVVNNIVKFIQLPIALVYWDKKNKYLNKFLWWSVEDKSESNTELNTVSNPFIDFRQFCRENQSQRQVVIQSCSKSSYRVFKRWIDLPICWTDLRLSNFKLFNSTNSFSHLQYLQLTCFSDIISNINQKQYQVQVSNPYYLIENLESPFYLYWYFFKYLLNQLSFNKQCLFWIQHQDSIFNLILIKQILDLKDVKEHSNNNNLDNSSNYSSLMRSNSALCNIEMNLASFLPKTSGGLISGYAEIMSAIKSFLLIPTIDIFIPFKIYIPNSILSVASKSI